MTQQFKLPPLPEGVKDSWDKRIGEAMQDYARQAIELDRQGRGEPLLDLRERLAEAHDSCLDDDHRGCRSILIEALARIDYAPKPSDPVVKESLTVAEPVKWEEAQRIADLPEVDELLQGFTEDPTGDAGTMIVRAVMQAVRQDAEPVKCNLPERDESKQAEQQGLFRKFDVRRTDGSDRPGGKHYGCRYFVLDVDHDRHAKAALSAYAVACEQSHPELAADLRDKWGAAEPVKEVSDEKIMELWNWWRGREHQIVKFARALLARYGQPAQPAASAEPMESLAALVNALRERHYGRMPDEVQQAYDRAWTIVYTAPTRELSRTRNGAKNLERTLEAAYVEIAGLRSELADAQQDNIGLIHLLALIREACGDNGKRMQDELVEYIRDEWQGHISHIALLKASLKAERADADEMRDTLREIITAWNDGSDVDVLIERAAALLEKS